MSSRLKTNILVVLLFSLIMNCTACMVPYKKENILCEYDDMDCLYYVKDEYKKYRYSDYIFDDISNGLYKKSTPNIADYRIGSGMLDYDIEGYVNARMDYAVKTELIKKYEMEFDKICEEVRDGYFEQRNSYVYFYSKGDRKNVLLHDGPVTNISYDDEIPTIAFDINVDEVSDEELAIEGRRIMLSDIIAANTTIDGYMKVILGTGKERLKYYMDMRIDNDGLFINATASNVIKK